MLFRSSLIVVTSVPGLQTPGGCLTDPDRLVVASVSMSASEVVSLAVSSSALVAVVVSNVFYARQAREMRTQTLNASRDLALSAHESMKTWYIEIGRIFIEHPELRPLFYADERNGPLVEPSTANRLRAATVAEHLLDSMEDAADFESNCSGV